MKGIEKELKKPHFGLHLTFDGYGCNPRILNSRAAAERFLNLLARDLKMRKLLGPKVVYTPGNDSKDPGGFSGFLIIQESHFSVHTFPKRRFVSIDVYSCRDFDCREASRFIKKFFHARSAEVYIVVRGRQYPLRNLA